MHRVPATPLSTGSPAPTVRESPHVSRATAVPSAVELRRRARVVLSLTLPGLLLIVLLLGWWSVVPMGIVAVAAIVTWLDPSTRIAG